MLLIPREYIPAMFYYSYLCLKTDLKAILLRNDQAQIHAVLNTHDKELHEQVNFQFIFDNV